MNPVLQVNGLSVHYGGVRALSEVSLDVGAGELVGLIGPNGAGKTTLIDAITGFTRSRGTVCLNGRDIGGRRPHARVRDGVARTWQAADLFDDLTVRQNLDVACSHHGWLHTARDVLRGRSDSPPDAERALNRLKIAEFADVSPTELGQGQRKLVGVARALATRPAVLLLDEPAAGLDTGESQELGCLLRDIVDDGTSAVLVDHDMGLVLNFCDRVYVLEFGVVIAAGTPEQVRSDPRVIEAYLGQGGSDQVEGAVAAVVAGGGSDG